jgi:thioesterase domain-containing protein
MQSGSRLVLLKPGRKSPPVFLTHGLGGHVGELAELARHLECDHPIYALQLPGLADEEETLSRIEEMAGLFVEPIIEAEPQGTCLLVGYSLGGLIAYELVRQLEAKGRDTRLLLLDSHPHPRYWPLDTWLNYLAVRIKAQCLHIARGETGDLPAYAGRLWHSLADHWRVRRGRRPNRIPSWLTESAPLQRIRTGMIAAKAKYRPPPYSGQVTFIQPEIRQLGAPEDPIGAWRGRVDAIDIAHVPGDHLSMVLSDVSATAAHLDFWVEDASTPR